MTHAEGPNLAAQHLLLLQERSQPLRVLSPDGPQSEQAAKKAMAHTMVVRKLLAHERLRRL